MLLKKKKEQKSHEKVMNILCSTDRNFLYPTYVFMWSVMKNHPDIYVRFFLMANKNVTDDDRKNLKAFINDNGNEINFIDVDASKYKKYKTTKTISIEMYYRLLAHEQLPKDVNKILYLDVDIIVNKNIYYDFYMLDFYGKYLITPSHNPDPTECNNLNKSNVNLKTAAGGGYFNSGVLLMNVELFRKNITIADYDKALKECENAGYNVFYDQGLLNYMFYDKTLYVSPMDFNYRYALDLKFSKFIDANKEYKKSIIHYTGMQPYKPWDLLLTDEEVEKFGDVPFDNNYFYVSKLCNDLSKLYWEYAKGTPIYNEFYAELNAKTTWFRRNLINIMLQYNKLRNEGCSPSNKK